MAHCSNFALFYLEKVSFWAKKVAFYSKWRSNREWRSITADTVYKRLAILPFLDKGRSEIFWALHSVACASCSLLLHSRGLIIIMRDLWRHFPFFALQRAKTEWICRKNDSLARTPSWSCLQIMHKIFCCMYYLNFCENFPSRAKSTYTVGRPHVPKKDPLISFRDT